MEPRESRIVRRTKESTPGTPKTLASPLALKLIS